MALITTGSKLIKDLETSGALAAFVPLEGGHEGRYQRRLRTAGYEVLVLSAKGLGDLSAYLTGVHGVRPPHLGKKEIRVYYVPPILQSHLEQLPAKSKGLVLWLIEGHILSSQEIQYLMSLPQSESRIKVVVERGGERFFDWKPLKETLVAA